MTISEWEAQQPKETPPMPEVVREYIMSHAKAEHGSAFYERRVAIAIELETLSDYARSENLQAIVNKYGSIGRASGRFEAANDFLGSLFIQAVTPRAFTYDEFVKECSKRVRKVSISALMCPLCDGEMVLEGHTIRCLDKQVEEAIYCRKCRYSESVEITFG